MAEKGQAGDVLGLPDLFIITFGLKPLITDIFWNIQKYLDSSDIFQQQP